MPTDPNNDRFSLPFENGEDGYDDELCNIFDILADATPGYGPLAERPEASELFAPKLYFATDQSPREAYLRVSRTWIQLFTGATFDGDHANLTNVQSDQHHPEYTDSKAQSALEGTSPTFGDVTSDSLNTQSVSSTDKLNLGGNGGVLKQSAWADDGNIYDTIQAAVDACDRLVIIGTGLFNENVELDKDDIHVEGQGKSTIINGGSTGPAVTLGVTNTENQQIRDFNVGCDPSSSVPAAVFVSPDADGTSQGNEYEIHNIAVQEEAPVQGATVGFDVSHGAYKELINCRSNFTSGAGFITEEAVVIGCHADIDCMGVGFDAKNRSRLVGCATHNVQGNNSFEVSGSQAINCAAYAGSGYGHFSLKGRAQVVGCYSHGAPSDYAFDLGGDASGLAWNTIDSPSATTGVRCRSEFSDNIIGPHTFFSPPATKISDNGTLTVINGIGKNAGDPNTTGDWNGNGIEGVQVYDTTNSAKYWYVNGSWV